MRTKDQGIALSGDLDGFDIEAEFLGEPYSLGIAGLENTSKVGHDLNPVFVYTILYILKSRVQCKEDPAFKLRRSMNLSATHLVMV